MALNFNVDPYYDDFDPTKNYHRILFKPGYAVQARELTQAQTILQNQISNFADAIFSQNTPVTGGQVTTNLNCYYIRLNATNNNVPVVASAFLNKVISDATGTVLAKVIATTEATGTTINPGDPPTLIVSYYSGIHFTDSNLITPTDGTNIAATVATSITNVPSTGLSSTASISNGVFYIVRGYSQSDTPNADGTYTKYSIGNFVQVNPQTIILSKYSNTPSYRVGLSIFETIADYVNDSTLLDPAAGASNYQAPGADRYQVTLTLTTLPLALGNDDGFIELLRIINGQIVKRVDGTVYSTIDDYFAKRDYETNGDYIVNDFKLTPAANTFNTNLYDLSVGPGVAYVHGYRVENQSNQVLTSDRARTVNQTINDDIYVDYGNFYYVDTANGVFDVATMPSVDFHSVTANNIVSTNNVTYSATQVGTGYIRNLSYVAGTGSQTNTYIYQAYINDFTANTLSGSVASATSTTIVINDTNGSFSPVANAYYNTTLALTSGTSAGDTRNIVSYTNSGGTKTITVDKPFTLTPDTTTKFTIQFMQFDVESIVVKSPSYGINASVNINSAYGKVNGLVTGDAILNGPGTPELIIPVGNPFVANISSSSYVSTKVFRNKNFTSSGLTLTIGSGPLRFVTDGHTPLNTSTVLNNYIVIDTSTGHILDFSTSGNTVSVASGSQSATFTSSSYTGKTVDVICRVNITSADAGGANNAGTILKSKNLVVSNTTIASTSGPDSGGALNSTTYVDLTNGQTYITNSGTGTGKISLYVADVKKVRKILDTGSPSTTPTTVGLSSYTDVTNQYVLNNGQKDNFYDHAFIQLIAGANPAKGNLLVFFDYYKHGGGDGYFSVLSYLSPALGGVSYSPEAYQNIGTYTAKDGNSYRLTDVLDFRPSRKNAQTGFIFEYTGNPTSDDTGILIPQNNTQFACNYAYYQGRKDLLVLSKDKSFQIVEGNPADNPTPPSQPDGSLLLANLTLDPYTAYVPGENPAGTPANLSIAKVQHNRWAKSDITDLQTRVNNLEYYTSLNVLEQNAQSLQVPDVNGLNRFKNGILVDDFSSFATADTTNADYGANINIRNKQLSPITIVDNFQLQNPIVTASLGTLTGTNTWAVSSINGTHTNIFTLPYTTANAVVQPLASSVVSLNPFAVTVYQGVASLNPPMDNWVDNTQAPSLLITDPNMQIYQQTNGVNVTNAGDFAIIPGTESTSTSSVSVINHGAFNGPFGGQVGYTATTTSTYASQLQNITTSGNYSPVSSTLSTNNGYLTNIAVLPYIRPQQIGFSVKGMLVNTPVSVWFDGTNVSQYITTPNTIELTSVNGTFNIDDIVGFYTSNKFYPVGRVLGVYNYPNTNNTRLYISKIVGVANYSTTTTFQNAQFDSNGNYTTSTANGTLNSGVSSIHTSGQLTGVGGSYTPQSGGSAQQIYKVSDPNDWCSFLNQYGVWGDLNQSASYNASFVTNFPTTGSYTFTTSTDNSATITLDGTTVVTSSSFTTTTSATVSVTAGNHTIAWAAVNTGGPAGIALTVTDQYGNMVFNSTNPPNLNYDSVGQEIVLPLGGAWFTGVTKIKLDQGANASSSSYYVGSKISISSKYVYQYTSQTATYVPPPPAPSGGGGGGGGKIICTKLYQLGLMDEEIYKADQAFGELLRQKDPAAYYGYIRWATIVVDWMSGQGPQCMFWIRDDEKRAKTQQRLAIKWAHRIATPWAEHMAYLMGQRDKDNFAGKLIMNIGKPISKFVNLLPKRNKEAGLATGYSMWAVFGFLYVISKIFGNKLFPKTINN